MFRAVCIPLLNKAFNLFNRISLLFTSIPIVDKTSISSYPAEIRHFATYSGNFCFINPIFHQLRVHHLAFYYYIIARKQLHLICLTIRPDTIVMPASYLYDIASYLLKDKITLGLLPGLAIST